MYAHIVHCAPLGYFIDLDTRKLFKGSSVTSRVWLKTYLIVAPPRPMNPAQFVSL